MAQYTKHPVAPPPTAPERESTGHLMLRGYARGKVLPRTLVDTMLLAADPGLRWLVWLVTGHATLRIEAGAKLTLNPQAAALVIPDGTAGRTLLEGAGEIVLVKLYA